MLLAAGYWQLAEFLKIFSLEFHSEKIQKDHSL